LFDNLPQCIINSCYQFFDNLPDQHIILDIDIDNLYDPPKKGKKGKKKKNLPGGYLTANVCSSDNQNK
jgi:hypothetical protein